MSVTVMNSGGAGRSSGCFLSLRVTAWRSGFCKINCAIWKSGYARPVISIRRASDSTPLSSGWKETLISGSGGG
jgi:hypothetical protein